jgi:RNA polymerase sigma factor FliA
MEERTTADPQTAAELAESLWRRWRDHQDIAARNRLVLTYAPMVKYLAARKVRDLPQYVELDDLVSVGLVALISSVNRFDPAKGASFEQFAWTRIAGAILDELRRLDWAPRSVRRTGRAVNQTRAEWQARHGQEPTVEQLSQTLEIPVSDLRGHIEDVERANVLSLNVPGRNSEGVAVTEVGELVLDETASLDPERAALSKERSTELRDAIASLSDREQRVLLLSVVGELQGAEIARIVGVSDSRVSQILSGIRTKLRSHPGSHDLVRAA